MTIALFPHMPSRNGARIRVLRVPDEIGFPGPAPEDARVFVTVGAGETHVTVLDEDGVCERRWTAIFGWSFLFSVPFVLDGVEIFFEEPESLERVLSGRTRIYGKLTDTGAFLQDATRLMARAIEDILDQTIGSGAIYSGIVLAAPVWLHGLLSGSIGIRPHILHDIREV